MTPGERSAWNAYHALAAATGSCGGTLDKRCLGCANLLANGLALGQEPEFRREIQGLWVGPEDNPHARKDDK